MTDTDTAQVGPTDAGRLKCAAHRIALTIRAKRQQGTTACFAKRRGEGGRNSGCFPLLSRQIKADKSYISSSLSLPPQEQEGNDPIDRRQHGQKNNHISYAIRNLSSKTSIFYVPFLPFPLPSLGVKEGRGCVFSSPQLRGKARNLTLP